uniref:Uncharacterized protein n=1 Tax=Rhizophora mucronata TaxID=61149 RepID=A0A2P2M6N9_RHIMU
MQIVELFFIESNTVMVYCIIWAYGFTNSLFDSVNVSVSMYKTCHSVIQGSLVVGKK